MAADERHHGGPVIGIDLGTTNSLVAICDERGPRVLAGSDASNLLPSVVRFDPSGVVVGEEARAGAIAHARQTVTSAKRLLGRSAEECNLAGEHLSLEVVGGPRDMSGTLASGGRFRTIRPASTRSAATSSSRTSTSTSVAASCSSNRSRCMGLGGSADDFRRGGNMGSIMTSAGGSPSVSYTHLTLPTILRV